jgi:menaquinone-dependent protoporphyrinogen oxidase
MIKKKIGVSMKRLIAYASMCGSTQEVAERIGALLPDTDVLPIEAVDDVARYDAVIIGSAIRAGSWLPEAAQFVTRHQEALAARPVALFTVCMTLAEDTPENRAIVAAYTDPIRKLITPVDEAFFAGVMNKGKLSRPTRLMISLMKVPEGDYRDWDAISDWAASVQEKLTPQPA